MRSCLTLFPPSPLGSGRVAWHTRADPVLIINRRLKLEVQKGRKVEGGMAHIAADDVWGRGEFGILITGRPGKKENGIETESVKSDK